MTNNSKMTVNITRVVVCYGDAKPYYSLTLSFLCCIFLQLAKLFSYSRYLRKVDAKRCKERILKVAEL